MPEFNWLAPYTQPALDWLTQNFASGDIIFQLAAIVVAFAVAQIGSTFLARQLGRRLQSSKPLALLRIYASYQEILFLLIGLVLLWAINLAAQDAGWPFAILKTAASLMTAWAIIRFSSSIIENAFWARLFAISLWIVAALNIFGLLDEATGIADRMAFSVGAFRLSLLLIIKGAIAFAILFWMVGFVTRLLDRGIDRATGLTPSQRVLFNKLSSITLYVIASIIGLQIVGLNLTSLAVFSGALGLGIGFGLQKVVSNLISGIILLMDKSIKPGDVIAVGDSYGWVNSLGARYVSVLTRDGKEHLLPNENLITQTVENWSYSDRKIRLHIPIGVSYASDIHLVRKLLLQAVEDHPRILKDPAPRCLIIGFGDSSIDHEVRAWIYDPQEGLSNVRSDIYYRIWDLFKEHGIEIPFPQRDVHVKSSTPITPGIGDV